MKFSSKNIALGFLFGSFVSISPSYGSIGFPVTNDPLKLYGTHHEFLVLRDGLVVGKHTVRFQQKADELIADTQFHIDIKLLGLSLYNYTYESREIWEADKLMKLEVKVDDDGSLKSHSLQYEANGYKLNGKLLNVPSSSLIPTNHWNPAVINKTNVFNTILGKINSVKILEVGNEPVQTNDGTISATRYQYSGDLKLDAWYDNKGRWVKLKFLAEDQSVIEYLCSTCEENRTQ